MSVVYFCSDLHLGHKNIHKFRTKFSSAEEHHEVIYDNVASCVKRRDTLYILGDAAFDEHWRQKLKELTCKTILILGNHDLERGSHIKDLVDVYDEIYALKTYKGFWLSHCPIHPDEMRNRKGNLHGHTHEHNVDDPRYINLSVEQTDYKPKPFLEILDEFNN